MGIIVSVAKLFGFVLLNEVAQYFLGWLISKFSKITTELVFKVLSSTAVRTALIRV